MHRADNVAAAQYAFEQRLCAMYNREYKIDSLEEMRELVRVADFYCALPVRWSLLHTYVLLSQSWSLLTRTGSTYDS
jgi:hypothetical protein